LTNADAQSKQHHANHGVLTYEYLYWFYNQANIYLQCYPIVLTNERNISQQWKIMVEKLQWGLAERQARLEWMAIAHDEFQDLVLQLRQEVLNREQLEKRNAQLQQLIRQVAGAGQTKTDSLEGDVVDGACTR
jgi:hypothetical protein